MKINKTCKICGKTEEIEMQEKDYNDWRNGKLLQYAAPYLDENQREILVSGICGSCFDEMFAEDED